MGPRILIIILFSLSTTLALPVLAGFYSSDKVPTKPKNLENAIAATFNLNVDDSDSHCTAFAISNDGYVLTSLHCLRSCFENGAEFYSESYYKKTEVAGIFNLWEVHSYYPQNQICRNYTSFDNKIYNTEPRIVALGRGKGSFEEKEITKIPQAIMNKIIKVSEDYAILKFDQVLQQPCLKIANKSAAGNKIFWTIGYPRKSNRYDGFDSDGHHQYISYGQKKISIKDDPYLKTIFKVKKEWDIESAMYDQSRFLLTNIDSLGGNSGGPIINNEGQLEALLFANVMPNTDKYEQATAIGLKATEIYKSVFKKLGRKKTTEIFNCQ